MRRQDSQICCIGINNAAAGSAQAASVTTPVGNNYSLTLPGTSTLFSGNDFGVEPIPGLNDLEIYITSAPAVPGLVRSYTLHYHHAGTTSLSGTMTFTADPQLTYFNGLGGGTLSGNTVTWTYTNLMPGQSGTKSVGFLVSPTVLIGSTLTHTAVINPIPGDETPANNTCTFVQPVVGSYDPNEKTVAPQGDIDPAQNLEYTVRFQNTGTYYAMNIVVRDTLDANLDLSTFHWLGTSHPCTWIIDQHVLTVTYNDIMLPDSNMNEAASHGSFAFSISPLPGLGDGAAIENSAAIYFDYNAPVITNTVTNTIEILATAGPLAENEAVVFPNPFSDEATVRTGSDLTGPWTLRVTDLSGKIVMEKTVASAGSAPTNEVKISRGSLNGGMYFYSIISNQKSVYSGKLVIQ